MALVKPMVNDIIAFDADIGAIITFTANGGDQVTGNEIKIVLNTEVRGYYNGDDGKFYKNYNPSTGTYSDQIIPQENMIYVDNLTSDTYYWESGQYIHFEGEHIIYQNTVSSYNLSQTIPAYVLKNGVYYKLSVRTYDAINNTSAWSNYQPFYCYTTPVLGINIVNNQTITVENYIVKLTYNQAQKEKIDYVLIQLYDNNNNLVDSSGYIYDTSTPPLTFSYTLIGLKNYSQYTIVATVMTINGTIVSTGNILFHTNYNTVIADTTLTATLDSCEGYVNLYSSSVTNLIGIPTPDPPTYIHNTKIDLLSAVDNIDNPLSSKVWWGGSLVVPTDFLFRLWFYPARQPFKLVEFKNNTTTESITLIFNRGASSDYISIRTLSGTVIDKDLGVICNGNTEVFLWIKIVGSEWTVQTEVIDSAPTILEWNNTNSNNIQYNVDSDVPYGGESVGDFTPSSSVYHELNNSLDELIIGNGIYDELNITTDTTLPYSIVIPDYDDNTILKVGFNNNLNNAAPYYNKLILKRRDDSLLNWLNLSELIVKPNVNNYINFNDSFIPTGIKQTYALVTYINNVESEYYTVDIIPKWSKVFLSDKDTRFVLNYAVIYSNHSQNVQNGVLMPIGAKYPIVIQNANGNYRSGSLQFKVLGYQYEIDKTLDRVSITQQTNDIVSFLTNGKAKCITDYNGNIFICKVVNSPQISYDANWGNGVTTISFDWVEQAKYNSYEEMLGLGLFDQIGE